MRSYVRLIAVLNVTITEVAGVVEARSGQRPDAEMYLSQPGLGVVLRARCSPSSKTSRTARA